MGLTWIFARRLWTFYTATKNVNCLICRSPSSGFSWTPAFSAGPEKIADEDDQKILINRLFDTVKRGSNLDALNHQIGHSGSKLSNVQVEEVLVRLSKSYSRCPAKAKSALKFLQWAGHKHQLKQTMLSHCITINMLVRANMFLYAQPLLESLIKKLQNETGGAKCSTSHAIFRTLFDVYHSMVSTPMVFDFLIQTYAKERMFDEASNVIRLMRENGGFVPRLRAWNTLLHVVQKSDKPALVWKIYEEMLVSQRHPNKITVGILVDALCKEGKMQTSIDLLERIQKKKSPVDGVVNAVLISGIMEEGRVKRANMLLRRMVRRSSISASVSYALMVYGYSVLGDLQKTREIHQVMMMKGFEACEFTYTALICCYCKNGMMREAENLMIEMVRQGLKPHAATYDCLITGYCREQCIDEAYHTFEIMLKERWVPCVSACNTLMEELCKRGSTSRANEMLTVLLDMEFKPDEDIYDKLIYGYCNEGNVQQILKLVTEIEHRKIVPSIVSICFVVRCLCRHNKLEEAKKIMHKVSQKDPSEKHVIYKSLIQVLNDMGLTIDAQHFQDEMIRHHLCSRRLSSSSTLSSS